jgi:hypothetical protein
MKTATFSFADYTVTYTEEDFKVRVTTPSGVRLVNDDEEAGELELFPCFGDTCGFVLFVAAGNLNEEDFIERLTTGKDSADNVMTYKIEEGV